MNSSRLLILDSLRGIASLIVLFHHLFKINASYFDTLSGSYIYSFFKIVSDLNREAVLFFFILSGFSIGLSLKKNSLTNFLEINNYYYRRFKRIFPIYWIALVVTFGCGCLTNNVHLRSFSLFNLLGNILFLQTSEVATPAWFIPYGLNGPLWSLAFEFFFYTLFPIAYIFNNKFLTIYSATYKFILLLALTILSIYVNKLIFIPYTLFFGKFILWILGYIMSITYLHKKRYDSVFIITFVFSIIAMLTKNSKFTSSSVHVLIVGFVISNLYYLFVIMTLNPGARIFGNVLTHIQIFINFLFSKIGKGSFAIYAFHYPFLLLLSHYEIPLQFQIVLLVILVSLCIFVEEKLLEYNFSFLKIKYITN